MGKIFICSIFLTTQVLAAASFLSLSEEKGSTFKTLGMWTCSNFSFCAKCAKGHPECTRQDSKTEMFGGALGKPSLWRRRKSINHFLVSVWPGIWNRFGAIGTAKPVLELGAVGKIFYCELGRYLSINLRSF